ncbi:hypothetical protein C8R44DRAFT_749361 [Mycena epipterygia]|nr:hypothetical protein C8R44DRAFT_749361 [Mycena epipterygia]
MSLVEDLRTRGIVDRVSAADIQKVSTYCLVAIVGRLVVGPESWSPPRIPVATTQIFLQTSGQTWQASATARTSRRKYTSGASVRTHCPASIDLSRASDAFPRRSPSRREVCPIFWSKALGALAWWRVADDSLVGIYNSGIPSSKIVDFAPEVLHGGERTNIDICFVEVISWDFATELLSMTDFTGTHGISYSGHPSLLEHGTQTKNLTARNTYCTARRGNPRRSFEKRRAV